MERSPSKYDAWISYSDPASRSAHAGSGQGCQLISCNICLIDIINSHLSAQSNLFGEQERQPCDLSTLKWYSFNNFLQKFLDRCIVEEGDPEDENYKVNWFIIGNMMKR